MAVNKFLPSFIPLALELWHQFSRNKSHDQNIKKLDKTQEKLATVEHMLVRLEKKIHNNRDEIKKLAFRVQLYLVINFAVLLAVLLKVFEVL